MIDKFLKQIPNFIPNYCDRCGAKHSKADVEIVSNSSKNILARLVCKNCGNISMMQVNLSLDGINAKKTSVYSDISSKNEVNKFFGLDPISTIEVADVFMILKGVKSYNDFEALFVDYLQPN
ncbi:MAG: hypothetical protein NZZ41_02505 [Candidatus Dojkabacteria bacterium]|nr:hypothetical protein [Candidatus Dojkabacteria bacterium]